MDSKCKINIDAVLFDMDGVLVDSEAVMAKAASIALRDYGVDSSEEEFKQFIGAGEIAYLGGVSSLHGVEYEPSMNEAAYTVYGELVKKGGVESIAPDYTAHVVKYLKSHGIKTAVCTGADKMKLDINIGALDLKNDFDVLISGQDVERNKPAPDIYLKASKILGVEPSRCLVAEDSKNGVKAAKAAGMMCLGITSSFTKEELVECGADITAETIEKIKELIW